MGQKLLLRAIASRSRQRVEYCVAAGAHCLRWVDCCEGSNRSTDSLNFPAMARVRSNAFALQLLGFLFGFRLLTARFSLPRLWLGCLFKLCVWISFMAFFTPLRDRHRARAHSDRVSIGSLDSPSSGFHHLAMSSFFSKTHRATFSDLRAHASRHRFDLIS